MRLGVNIDHVATLRQARRGIEPEPVLAALVVEQAGADSVVVHLREDRRHIQDKDVFMLKRVLSCRLNLEMSCRQDIVEIACEVKPDQATLVPEKRNELTTEGGLEVAAQKNHIKKVVSRLRESGIEVSLFIDPVKKQIEAARECGVKLVELHTGLYANAQNYQKRKFSLEQLKSAAHFAHELGLRVAAGHGLDYYNVIEICGIAHIEELNIGYAIITRALFVGLANAVKQMKSLIRQA